MTVTTIMSLTVVKEKRFMEDDVHLRLIKYDGESRNVSNVLTSAWLPSSDEPHALLEKINFIL